MSIDNWNWSGLVAPWEPSHPDRNRLLAPSFGRWRHPHSAPLPISLKDWLFSSGRHGIAILEIVEKQAAAQGVQKYAIWRVKAILIPQYFLPGRWCGTSAIIPFVTAPYSSSSPGVDSIAKKPFLQRVSSLKTTMAFDAYYRDAYYRINMDNSLSTNRKSHIVGLNIGWILRTPKYRINMDNSLSTGKGHIVGLKVAYYSIRWMCC